MNIAYNAVRWRHAASPPLPTFTATRATAALAAVGYRASRDQHHYRVIQSLRESIGADAALINTFETFRKKRNVTGYERVGLVSDADADSMRALALQVRDQVTA